MTVGRASGLGIADRAWVNRPAPVTSKPPSAGVKRRGVCDPYSPDSPPPPSRSTWAPRRVWRTSRRIRRPSTLASRGRGLLQQEEQPPDLHWQKPLLGYRGLRRRSSLARLPALRGNSRLRPRTWPPGSSRTLDAHLPSRLTKGSIPRRRRLPPVPNSSEHAREFFSGDRFSSPPPPTSAASLRSMPTRPPWLRRHYGSRIFPTGCGLKATSHRNPSGSTK